jgi:predicted DCC family thiol-disulfide oxidoreductase YuxK
MIATAVELTLYFDGCCAFCAHEMARLKAWNQRGRLAFVDISTLDFKLEGPSPTLLELDREMHALDRSGRWLVGIDAIIASYQLLGRGYLVWPLRLRPLRPLFISLYRTFARHRYRISRLLGVNAPACESDRCTARHPFFSSRAS